MDKKMFDTPVFGSPDAFPSFMDRLGDRKAKGYIQQPLGDKKESLNLQLFQSLSNDSTILSLVVNDKYIFGGSKEGLIKVWYKNTFLLKEVLIGHKRAVLCLSFNHDNTLLFSGSSDDTIRVWDIKTLSENFLINTAPNVGDILCMYYHELTKTLYFGCQNTSIQWFNLDTLLNTQPLEPPSQDILPTENDFKEIPGLPPTSNLKTFFNLQSIHQLNHFNIPQNCVLDFAHHSAVYSIIIDLLPDSEEFCLFSGSGDGNIKIWKIEDNGLNLIKTLNGGEDILSIYSLQIKDSLLYAGLQGGNINVYDLDTFQKIRTLIGHNDDIMSMSILNYELYSGCANGVIKKWNRNLECVGTLKAHDNMILTMLSDELHLFTGGSDPYIKVWKIHYAFNSPLLLQNSPNNQSILLSEDFKKHVEDDSIDNIIHVLEKFLLIPSISGTLKHQEDCRLASKFLKNLFIQLGAECKLIKNSSGGNALIYAKFNANKEFESIKDVLFYGHYDVVSAVPNDWINKNPFLLNGKDGYLYGRGIADNKGPIITMIFTIYELIYQKQLKHNIHFLLEGEEESGSIGFYDTVKSFSNQIGNIDLILLSNSYWLGETIPCLTYGLRGVIHASIKISNKNSDSHSGVYGGVIVEPLIDLTHLLAKMVSYKDNIVLIPGFYDDVVDMSSQEEKEYIELVEAFNKLEQSKQINIEKIESQWRKPTFTLHKIHSSGPKQHSTVIPCWATADVSMRIVPNMKIEKIRELFIDYVKQQFNGLESENDIEVYIRQTSDWWLGDRSNKYYDLMTQEIEKEWEIKPLNIREGGSIPTVPWLEKHFNATAIHFPMGQSSDQAHLANERLRIKNLIKAKTILKSFLNRLNEV